MKYRLYRLSFPNGIHLGERSLDESHFDIKADTLFSALYIEALKRSQKDAEDLLQAAKTGGFSLSDAFPYIGDIEYLPKPACAVEYVDQQGDSVAKKAFKALAYIPMDKMASYLEGHLDAVSEKAKMSSLGVHSVKVSAAIHGQEETRPYHVGTFHFGAGNGLYVIIACEDQDKVKTMLQGLSYAGLGGKRSAGYGRFCIEAVKELPDSPFTEEGHLYMSLSVGLPREDEMQECCSEASFQLVKRSGFVLSETYASEQRKKKDLFVMGAGSCFAKRFVGDVYDVGDDGMHPVYRYAKPLFWTLRR